MAYSSILVLILDSHLYVNGPYIFAPPIKSNRAVFNGSLHGNSLASIEPMKVNADISSCPMALGTAKASGIVAVSF